MQDNRRICQNCRFWVEHKAPKTNDRVLELLPKVEEPNIGSCMRYPPTTNSLMYETEHPVSHQIQVIRENVTNYPSVHNDAFCGEFANK